MEVSILLPVLEQSTAGPLGFLQLQTKAYMLLSNDPILCLEQSTAGPVEIILQLGVPCNNLALSLFVNLYHHSYYDT